MLTPSEEIPSRGTQKLHVLGALHCICVSYGMASGVRYELQSVRLYNAIASFAQ